MDVTQNLALTGGGAIALDVPDYEGTGMLRKMRHAFLPYEGKKLGAILSLESMMYIAILLIFAAIGLGVFSMRTSAKVSVAKTEMDQIRAALLEYNNSSKSNAWPSDPSVLFEVMPADQSIDGLQHGPFLQASGRWAKKQPEDPFGGTYTLQTEADGQYITMQGGTYPDGVADVKLRYN